MARKPNYKFERMERDRAKALKKSQRLEANREKAEKKRAEGDDLEAPVDEAAEPRQDDNPAR